METNSKFGIKKCLEYINQIEDFEIEFERKLSLDEDSGTFSYESQMIQMKSFLKKFIIRCEKESLNHASDFLHWLNERRMFWQSQEYRVMGSLMVRLEHAKGDHRTRLVKKKGFYAAFFRHNNQVIEMIESDIINTLERPNVYLAPVDNITPLAQPSISSFDELFKEGIDPAPYYQLLRDHEYPLIGNEFNYISKALKGGFCIWIYELQKNNTIKRQPDKIYAELLLKKIKGLKTFSESMFRKMNNAAEERYGEWFRRRIKIASH